MGVKVIKNEPGVDRSRILCPQCGQPFGENHVCGQPQPGAKPMTEQQAAQAQQKFFEWLNHVVQDIDRRLKQLEEATINLINQNNHQEGRLNRVEKRHSKEKKVVKKLAKKAGIDYEA